MSRTRVLVLPGLAASDTSTTVMRSVLKAQGHKAHGWRLGRNEGPTDETVGQLRARLRELAERDGESIALVGWSLGGLYSHWLARSDPTLVRSVITLGSPLARQGPRPSLPVPTTSVYSRNDNVVPWRASVVDDTIFGHENVEVRSPHLGLGFDPAVLHVISDRLRRPVSRWKPFRPPLWMKPAFPTSTES